MFPGIGLVLALLFLCRPRDQTQEVEASPAPAGD
jgi:hypothetical protein